MFENLSAISFSSMFLKRFVREEAQRPGIPLPELLHGVDTFKIQDRNGGFYLINLGSEC